MSEENKEQVETIDIKGYNIPKTAYEAIVNSVQSKVNQQHKSQLAQLIGEQEADKLTLGQAMNTIKDKLGDLEAQVNKKTEEKVTDKLELERQKLQAEYEAKERARQADWMKQQHIETIKAHAIKNGLTPEFTDLFPSLLNQHFELEMNDNKILYKDKKTEGIVFDDAANPAGPDKVADLLKQKFPGAFSQAKQGLGAKPNGAPDKSSWDKMSARELLSSR